MHKLVLLAISPLLMFSCQKELKPKDFIAWLNNPENGLRKTAAADDFELEVKYEPIAYAKANAQIQELEEPDQSYEEYEHFQFRIKSLKGDPLRINEVETNNEMTRIRHFSFDAKNDFKIINDNDTSYCKLAVYSRNYNLSPSIDLSLSFEKIKKEGDWQFIYKDQIFQLGTTKFLFSEKDLNNIPLLVL